MNNIWRITIFTFVVLLLGFTSSSFAGKEVRVLKAQSTDEVKSAIYKTFPECEFVAVKYSGGQWEMKAKKSNCRGKIEIYASNADGKTIFLNNGSDSEYVKIEVKGFDSLGGADKIADKIANAFD